MTQGIFVTGTDTGVGKTLVTAGIIRWLRKHWTDVAPMKPVQTGAEKQENMFIAPDLEFSLTASSLKPDAEERRMMAPYLYEPACSPHLAGRLTGCYPDIATIQKYAEIILSHRQKLVVEGAGGILVPLNENETMLDLMKALGYPVVLVSRIGLGAINHALLSINILNTAGIKLVGVVFNQTEPPLPENRYIEEDNPKAVEQFGKVKILGNIGYFERFEQSEDLWERFERSMPGLVDIKAVLE
jgi:dethiobiotin synthetase